ncbi:MAG: hypothetical protein AAF614_24885 [Chloroflexota bacterium]
MHPQSFNRPLPANFQRDDSMWALSLARLETAVMCRQHAPKNSPRNSEEPPKKRPFLPSLRAANSD